MKKTDKIEMLEKKIECLANTVKTMSCRAYASNLLTRCKLKGYVVKKNDDKTVLEDPERSGWYIEAYETRVDVYEDGLLKRRILSDCECRYSYWPNGELYAEVWKELTTGLTSEVNTYTEKGELAESTQKKRDSSGETVHEYAQTFEHTEQKVDEERGRLIKTTEFCNDLIDKNKTSYSVAVTFEKKDGLLYEVVSTVDDYACVTYGEHDKLGNVVHCIKDSNGTSIELTYDEKGIVCLTVINRDDGLLTDLKCIYLKETCKDRELMTHWEKVIEFVKKKKYKKLMLKRHWYDIGDNKFTEKVDEILRRSVTLDLVDLDSVEFVKGVLCE